MQRLLGLAIFAGCLIAAMQFSGGFAPFSDVPALTVVLLIGLSAALAPKADQTRIAAFGDGCLRGGYIGFALGLIVLVAQWDGDLATLGAPLAVALLTLFWGAALYHAAKLA